MKLEMGKVREFARAVHSTHPSHCSEQPVIPATFLATEAHWDGQGSGVFPEPDRLLHGGYEVTFPEGPPHTGDAWLTITSGVDKTYVKQGRRAGQMTFVELVSDYTDEAGRAVAKVRQTVIVTVSAEGA